MPTDERETLAAKVKAAKPRLFSDGTVADGLLHLTYAERDYLLALLTPSPTAGERVSMCGAHAKRANGGGRCRNPATAGYRQTRVYGPGKLREAVLLRCDEHALHSRPEPLRPTPDDREDGE